MMQIVPNTLQTDSGDQPDSSCLSQKQKIKGDLRSWSETPPQLQAVGRPRRGPQVGRRLVWASLWVEEALGEEAGHPQCTGSHAASLLPRASPAIFP